MKKWNVRDQCNGTGTSYNCAKVPKRSATGDFNRLQFRHRLVREANAKSE